MAASGYKVGIVIPAYNAAPTIAAVVRACRNYLDDVVVIDDGSRDETGTLAAAAGARVVRHETNRGKGEALQTGLATAQASGWHAFITLDADAQHAAKDIPKFLHFIASSRTL